MEQIADGVHVVRGGVTRWANIYLIEGPNGMTVFEAGIKGMHGRVLKAAKGYGGIDRLVLSHAHPDHRGAAPAIAKTGVPVYCHEAELADAKSSDGGVHYFRFDEVPRRPGRLLIKKSLPRWDDGPVPIEGTLVEGDEVAGFQVIHLPGHAPGLIGLYREKDGLVLSSDTIYTFDPLTGIKCDAQIPYAGFCFDYELAKCSALKLSAIDPQTIWAGHAGPVTQDAAAVLESLSH
jgi:glyoxylase-like metal-dependent hydrolase (beta-lactamase superfamily II)